MSLITRQQRQQLLANGRAGREARRGGLAFDPFPVVQLVSQDEWPRWLLSEIDPQNPDRAFGICDLGDAPPQLGTVSLRGVGVLKAVLGIDVRQPRGFIADLSVSEYLECLRVHGRIIL